MGDHIHYLDEVQQENNQQMEEVEALLPPLINPNAPVEVVLQDPPDAQPPLAPPPAIAEPPQLQDDAVFVGIPMNPGLGNLMRVFHALDMLPVHENIPDGYFVEDPDEPEIARGAPGSRIIELIDVNNSNVNEKRRVIDCTYEDIMEYGNLTRLFAAIRHCFPDAFSEFDPSVCHLRHFYVNDRRERVSLETNDDGRLAMLVQPHPTIEFYLWRVGKHIPTRLQQRGAAVMRRLRAREARARQEAIERARQVTLENRRAHSEWARQRSRALMERRRQEEEEQRRREEEKQRQAEGEQESTEEEIEEDDEDDDDDAGDDNFEDTNDTDDDEEKGQPGEERRQLEEEEENLEDEHADEPSDESEQNAEVPISVYRDVYSDDSLFDDNNLVVTIANGCLYEVYGKFVTANDGTVMIDVIKNHQLEEVTHLFVEKSSFIAYLRNYLKQLISDKKVKPKKFDLFKRSVNETVNQILRRYDGLQFYTGSSLDVNCTIGMMEIRDDVPVFMFFRHGITREELY